MSLCNLCQGLWRWRIKDTGELDRQAWRDPHSKYTHHSTYGDLISSARSCELCRAIWLRIRSDSLTEPYTSDFTKDARFEMSHWFGALAEVFVAGQQVALLNTKPLEYGTPGIGDTSENNVKRNLDNNISRPVDVVSLNRQASFEFLKDAVETCMVNHKDCRAKGNVPMPTRLLKITASSELVYLFESGGHLGRYAALSYCCGKERFLRLINHNEASLLAGFPVQMLPKCFQEAISLSQQLGLEYIWIDSLCIRQDDTEDWAKEAAAMASIYSNAYVTIAATSSRDPFDGIQRSNELWRFVPVQNSPDDPPIAIAEENHLSARYLQFCTGKVQYHCNGGFANSHGVVGAVRERYWMADKTLRTLDHWYRLAMLFASRELTVATDALPAIAGIAQVFSENLQAIYGAGIWFTGGVNNDVTGLAWWSMHGWKPATEYIVPSWSWMSTMKPLFVWGLRPCLRIEEYNAQAKFDDPFGQLTNAQIIVTGQVASFDLAVSKGPESSIQECNVRQEPLLQGSFNIDQASRDARVFGWRDAELYLDIDNVSGDFPVTLLGVLLGQKDEPALPSQQRDSVEWWLLIARIHNAKQWGITHSHIEQENGAQETTFVRIGLLAVKDVNTEMEFTSSQCITLV